MSCLFSYLYTLTFTVKGFKVTQLYIYIYISQSAKRHLQDVLKMSFQDRQDILPRHLADFQKMS